MDSCNDYFVSDLFHSIVYLWNSSVLFDVSVVLLHCYVVFYYMIISQFVYPFDCWRTFGLFIVLVIVNTAMMGILIYAILMEISLASVGYISLSGMMSAASLGYWSLGYVLV